MMIRLLLIFLLFSTLTNAQSKVADSIYSFKLKDSKAYWQKIYETDLEGNEVIKTFKTAVISSMSLDNLQEFENRLTFELEGDEVDFKKYGGKWGNTLIFIQYPLDYLVQVDFKENRYRVTVKNIVSDTSAAGVSPSNMEESLTKKKRTVFMRGKTVLDGLRYLDRHFNDQFEIGKLKIQNDDW